jgi:hypothetical protein
MHDGLSNDLGSIFRLSAARTRSVSPENPSGEPGGGARSEPEPADGPARELGHGWKCRPCVPVGPGETLVLADVQGPGCLQHLWMTPTGTWRECILRFYWDGAEAPAIEVPLADFFCATWADRRRFVPVVSQPICVNPGSAFNCYWPMPFRQRARVTLQNVGLDSMMLFWQLDYALNDVPADAAYLHAQYRQSVPVAGGVHTILDGVRGKGHYVGTSMAWRTHRDGWWGEGEVKFFLDSDGADPTICGTGTEDYFCGSYDFEDLGAKRYVPFNTPFAGLPDVRPLDAIYQSGQRFSMYRWHIPDPIRFEEALRVTVQAMGWQQGGLFALLEDDIASVAWWYQRSPAAPFPDLPDREALALG